MAFFALAPLALLWLAPEAPILRIHAGTAVHIDVPRRTPGGMVVSGRLFDDDTGAPVAGRPVIVDVDGSPESGIKRTEYILTRPDGTFRLLVQAPQGRYLVHARFEGDDFHDGSRSEAEVDVSRRPLELRWQGPERVVRGQHARFRLRADSDGEPADVAVAISGAAGPLRLRDGAIELDVEASGRGIRRLTASFPGDTEFAPAQAETRYLVEVPVTLELVSEASGKLRRGDLLALTGRIRDTDGPLPLASLAIRVLGRSVATVQADALGEFSARIGTRDMPAGRLEIDAHYRPSASFHNETRSQPLVLTLYEPEPPPFYAFALPALATVASFGAWRLLRGLAARPRPGARAPARTASGPPAGAGGVRMAEPPRARRTTDFLIEGVVLDARTGARIAQATVALDGSESPAPSGQFELTADPGRHAVVVDAPGYVPEWFWADLPHRGQLRGIEVLLQPFRLRVLAEFRAAAAPLLKDPAQFDFQTPREIARSGGAELRALAQLVEATSYSPRPVAADDVAHAQMLRERALDHSRPVP